MRGRPALFVALLALVAVGSAFALLPSDGDGSFSLSNNGGKVTKNGDGSLPSSLAFAASSSSSSSSTGNSLSDSRSGLFIVQGPNIKPGQQVVGSVTMSIQGQPSTISLSESNVTHTTCGSCPVGVGTGNLASYLVLTIRDTAFSPAAVLYTGPLAPPSGSLGPGNALIICGVGTSGGGPKAGGCPAWANKEAHTLSFTVAFPDGPTINNYQGTSASLEFDWTRVKA